MILAFVSQKGGVGKSTLAASVAWELHHRDHRVLLVDADPQGTVRVAGEVAAEQNRSAPTIVSLGKDMYRPDQLPRLAENFDHIIIDTPGRLGDVQRAALMLADLALVPVGQSAADTWGTTETLDVIEQAQVLRPTMAAAMVITRKMPRTSLGKMAREVLSSSSMPVFRAETTYRVAWQEALAAGQGVAQYAPSDAAATELRNVVDEIFTFMAQTERKAVNG
jgi:chromosome partitioning protein